MTIYDQLVEEFYASPHKSFAVFLREKQAKGFVLPEEGTMTASSIPQAVVPEVINKKDPKEESLITEADEQDGIIHAFLKKTGALDVDPDLVDQFFERLAQYLKAYQAPEDNGKADKIIDQFILLLYQAKLDKLPDDEKEELAKTIQLLFVKKKKDESLKEDIVDDINGVFNEAFGPFGERMGVAFEGVGDFMAFVGKDVWDKYMEDAEKEGKEDRPEPPKVEPKSKDKKLIDSLSDEEKEIKVGEPLFRKKSGTWLVMDGEGELSEHKDKGEAIHAFGKRSKEMADHEKSMLAKKQADEKKAKDSFMQHLKAEYEAERKAAKAKKSGKPDQTPKEPQTKPAKDKPAKDEKPSKQDLKLPPEEYRKKFGKCPIGFTWDPKSKKCVKPS